MWTLECLSLLFSLPVVQGILLDSNKELVSMILLTCVRMYPYHTQLGVHIQTLYTFILL